MGWVAVLVSHQLKTGQFWISELNLIIFVNWEEGLWLVVALCISSYKVHQEDAENTFVFLCY